MLKINLLLIPVILLLTGCEIFNSTPVGGVVSGRTDTFAEYLDDVEEDNEEDYSPIDPLSDFSAAFDDGDPENFKY